MLRRGVVLALLVGCSSGGAKKEPPRAADASVAVVRATADAGARPHAPALVERDDVEAFVARWLDVQNKGDFDAYAAMYADEFRGIRRSGGKTVRMDHARWIVERKRMFSRPMKVVATDLAITVAPKGAIVRFTQEWASGKYHDIGPKQLELEARPGGALTIIREEMLASKLVAAPSTASGAPALWPIHEGAIVVTGEANVEWGAGRVSLDDGEYRTQDPDLNCEDDPPDYESESDRYWACNDSAPSNAWANWAASRAADPRKVPAQHASWIGRSVRIGGGATPCTATVRGLRLVSRWQATMEAAGAGGTTPAELAATVLARAPVLVATVDGGCEGSWAVPAVGAAPVEWTISSVPDPLARKASAAFARVEGYEDVWDARDALSLIAGPDGKRLILATRDGYRSCQEAGGLGALYVVDDQDGLELVFETSDPVALKAAVDASGDGWPELVLGDGLVVRDPDDVWDRWQPIAFPDEVGDCYCECE